MSGSKEGTPDVSDYNLLADGFHVSCGVELEFMSRIPKPKGSTGHYPYEFVTRSLNKGSPDLRFKFNDLSGTEKFDYEKAWTITLDETLGPDPSDPPAVSGQSNSMFLRIPNRKRNLQRGISL